MTSEAELLKKLHCAAALVYRDHDEAAVFMFCMGMFLATASILSRGTVHEDAVSAVRRLHAFMV